MSAGRCLYTYARTVLSSLSHITHRVSLLVEVVAGRVGVLRHLPRFHAVEHLVELRPHVFAELVTHTAGPAGDAARVILVDTGHEGVFVEVSAVDRASGGAVEREVRYEAGQNLTATVVASCGDGRVDMAL